MACNNCFDPHWIDEPWLGNDYFDRFVDPHFDPFYDDRFGLRTPCCWDEHNLSCHMRFDRDFWHRRCGCGGGCGGCGGCGGGCGCNSGCGCH